MSNKRRLKLVKVYAKNHDIMVKTHEALQGAPLTRRQKRSMRANVPLGSYRIDHLEPHQWYNNCDPVKCRPLWR